MPWTQLTVSLLVLFGTGMQALLALNEIATAERADLDDWLAEDDLVRELPRKSRRQARRELEAMRSPEAKSAIIRMRLGVLGWTFLFLAALVATAAAIIQLAS